MHPNLHEVTLETLGNGLVGELFAHELAKVLENIDDSNTDPEATRKVTIDVIFKPAKSREAASVIVAVKSKLAGVEPAETLVHLSRERNRLVALAADPNQEELDFAKTRPAVIHGGAHADS